MVYKMDISAITALNNVNGTATVSPTSLTGMLAEKEKKAEGTMFETFLNTAIDNVKTAISQMPKMRRSASHWARRTIRMT